MSYNPYEKLTGVRVAHPWGTYGIEVEAERINAAELARITEHLPVQHPRLQEVLTYWNGTTDGSLRHNGVEWISPPVQIGRAEESLAVLYRAMDDGLFVPSVRTGIHIHVNTSPLTNSEVVEVLRAYAVLEPLLFRFVGVEREQNIYCVPLYRAANEQRLWRDIAQYLHKDSLNRNDHQRAYAAFRACCKYSALNISTFIRLGTFEFRHAPTFDNSTAATNWLRLVAAVSEFRLEADATEDSLLPAKAWATQLVPGLDWADYVTEVRERGLLGFANSLQPFTYKVAEWGKPAGLAFDRQPMQLRPQAQRPARREARMTFDTSLEALLAQHNAIFIDQPAATQSEPEPEDLGEPEYNDHDDEENY